MRKEAPIIPPKVVAALIWVILGPMLLVTAPLLVPSLLIAVCIDKIRERAAPYESEYHPWFAWRPVKTWGNVWVWLEPIERRRVGWFDAFYQLPPAPPQRKD